jgi:hypothetical protein
MDRRNLNQYGFSCTFCEELMRINPLLYGLAYTHVTELICLNLLKHSLYYIVLHTLTQQTKKTYKFSHVTFLSVS